MDYSYTCIAAYMQAHAHDDAHMCQPNTSMYHCTPAASKKCTRNMEIPTLATKAARKKMEVADLVDSSSDEAEADSSASMRVKQECTKEEHVVKEEQSDEEEEEDNGIASTVMENNAKQYGRNPRWQMHKRAGTACATTKQGQYG